MKMEVAWQLIDFHDRKRGLKAMRKVFLNYLHRKLRREFFRILAGVLLSGHQPASQEVLRQVVFP